ncbi:MAG: DNA polymerase I, partial [Deltaproteobacteria bacterium]|nr:DNA polymerase I [Deltaproteobacteria bacterium]
MPDVNEQSTLILVDGSNYVFRAFYAIRDLTNSKGFPTNAIYGFTTMLMKLRRDYDSQYLAVVFDLQGPTFRHEAYEDYKANRKAIPEALIPQFPCIKDVIRGFSIPILEQQGIEADDIIGTLARRYAGEGMKVIIVSGDKDMMQLVTDDVAMVDTMKDKTYDAAAVKERFGVGPEKVVEILGLMGDASDNIPGVPGIGPKGALALIEEYGTVAEAIKNIDKIKSARMRESLREFADQALLSRELAQIKTDVEIDFDLDQARCDAPDNARLRELFSEFEFSSLLQDLKLSEASITGNYRLILATEEFAVLLDELRQAQEFSLDILLTGAEVMRAQIVGLSICCKEGEACYIPLHHDYDEAPRQLSEEQVWDGLRPFLRDEKIKKHCHDLKNILIILSRQGLELRGAAMDTMVASYVLNPAQRSIDLADVVREHLHRQIITAKEFLGSGAKTMPPAGIFVDKTCDYACQRTDGIFNLAGVMAAEIRRDGFDHLFHNVEMPLIAVLAAMEKKGVLLDLQLFRALSGELAELLSLSEEKIYRLAGEKFNINSPKQLQVVLFEKLGLLRGKKTKDGYSTDVEVLAKLAKSHELPAEILAYRSLAKLKSTYADALPLLVNPGTGRVHTSYNQTVAATGRLSSSNPNLQNIPVRTVEGKRIRQAFIAPEGWEIVSADYSQIELRVLAHLSRDEALLAAFASGEDIHRRTASDVFGIFPEMVNAEMRRQAKVINFGILYGMGAFSLAKELGVAQKLAQAYIDGYFRKYAGVRSYLDGILEQARRDGFVTTLLNRRRYLPELMSSNQIVRQFAERMAINTPIQGTAAELIKVAMLNIAGAIKTRGLKAAMIMQVHDELVLETPAAEKDEIMLLVK